MKLLRVMLFAVLALMAARAETVAELGKPTGYINDYADVFTPEEHLRLELLCRQFHEQAHAQIFVVTVQSLSGEGVAPYANELFHTWKIGEAKTDRGLLLLLSLKEHERRIEVGYGFEGALNDAKAGDIGRAMVPDLRAGKYAAATDEALRSLIAEVAPEVTLPGTDEPPQNAAADVLADDRAPDAQTEEAAGGGVGAFFPLLALAFILFLLLIVIVSAVLKRGGGGASAGGSIDRFGSGSSSSGSSSSESSSSSSSSDSSFSGGDGGDSGGGGADGTW